jgi:hypothetical protein
MIRLSCRSCAISLLEDITRRSLRTALWALSMAEGGDCSPATRYWATACSHPWRNGHRRGCRWRSSLCAGCFTREPSSYQGAVRIPGACSRRSLLCLANTSFLEWIHPLPGSIDLFCSGQGRRFHPVLSVCCVRQASIALVPSDCISSLDLDRVIRSLLCLPLWSTACCLMRALHGVDMAAAMPFRSPSLILAFHLPLCVVSLISILHTGLAGGVAILLYLSSRPGDLCRDCSGLLSQNHHCSRPNQTAYPSECTVHGFLQIYLEPTHEGKPSHRGLQINRWAIAGHFSAGQLVAYRVSCLSKTPC